MRMVTTEKDLHGLQLTNFKKVLRCAFYGVAPLIRSAGNYSQLLRLQFTCFHS